MNAKKIRIAGSILVGAIWAGLTLGAWLHSPAEFSQAERRKLQQFPELSPKTVLNGKFMGKFETYTLDQFPLRDSFRQLKAVVSYDVFRQKDNNGIYLTDGYAAKLEYPLHEQSLHGAVEKFKKLHDQYLKDSKVVFAVVPDKGYYLAEKNGYLSMDYEKLFSVMKEGMPWASYVDLTDTLSIADYYKTDTHWRQERLLPAAGKLAAALGVRGPEEEDFRKTALKRPFYGVYYGQAALPMASETMYILESEATRQAVVRNLDTNQQAPVYDLDRENGKDPYDVFLSGPQSIQIIQNPQGPDRELIVFRDSFGSSLTPLLIQDYRTITVIDTRYVPGDYLGKFVDFHGQDVLMLYSPLVLNQSAMLK